MRSSTSSQPAGAAPADDPSDVLAGTPYRALGPLGQGGMGEVIEAEHRGLRKRVVVKLLHPQFAGEPRFVDRMRVEAQTLAAVCSPHVVSVSDMGQTAAGRPYLVMELLHGQTLGDEMRTRGGTLPTPEAIGIVRQVLAGLAAAHRLGIIHRDVKPGNVFICAAPDGGARLVKVLDFGIAKVLRRDNSPMAVPAPQYATEEGALVGSPRTISPEQARCQKVDERSDVYAVGVMLYTLIVGDGPFAHARDMLELLNAHISEVPALPSRAAKQPVPPELDRAILKALAKRPDDRFQTAEAFSEELGRIACILADTTLPFVPRARSSNPSPVASAPGSVPPAALVAVPDDGDARTIVRPVSLATAGRTNLGPASASGLGPEVEAWFSLAPDELPLTELPPNLTPPPDERGEAREFLFAVTVSTVAFALIAAIVFRYLGYAGWH
jgi:serine/threonine-protein kinase